MILGIAVGRVSQSLDPTLERIGKLWRADPTKTMVAILDAVDRLTPMPEAELDNRIKMAEGRANLDTTHPLRERA